VLVALTFLNSLAPEGYGPNDDANASNDDANASNDDANASNRHEGFEVCAANGNEQGNGNKSGPSFYYPSTFQPSIRRSRRR